MQAVTKLRLRRIALSFILLLLFFVIIIIIIIINEYD